MPHFKPSAAFIILFVLAVGFPAHKASAQDTPEPEFSERIEVNEVLLDVVVTDPNGNVILGLDEDDFLVEDGGEPVDLRDVTFYSNRRYLESAGLADRLGVNPEEVPVDRFFILLFHDPRQDFPDLIGQHLDALRWARRWVHQELLPNDYVAVVSYDTKLKVHEDFTLDNQAILRALDSVAKGKDPGTNWPSRIEAREEGPSLLVNMPRGKDLRRATRKIYGALGELADAAGHIVGRKNLLMFSTGFGNNNDFGTPLGPAAFASGRNFETFSPDERYYPHTVESLNDNNVAVYGVSLVENLIDETVADGFLNNGLSLISSDTGGRYYFNFVNFRDPLREVVEDNNGYYLLSYAARHPRGEEGFQEVSVKARNPSFVVRARKGYRYGDS